MKKVYQVKGSEDGTLGIYGSKKRAVARAIAYVKECAEGEAVATESGEYFVNVEAADTRITADVELFYVE